MTRKLTRLVVVCWYLFFLPLIANYASAQKVEVITVTGKGSSIERAEAVSRALIEAVGKVNPTAVSAIDQVAKRSRKKNFKG